MTGWTKDKQWSDRFLPEIKSILGRALISEAPPEEDATHGTDLIVLTLHPYRIACRVRKHHYLAPYGNEFTIRSGRPSGAKTELTKIIEGWGDYFFYGFANAEETTLAQWFLGDLKAFRIWHSRQLLTGAGKLPGKLQFNFDGSSSRT
ncbi:MAG: hypothetical protein LBR38_01000 [Synergistaceae bacterium]|jgi:hypothetical protein|nr:hypothetical protein [Synergistaceae bacterium]